MTPAWYVVWSRPQQEARARENLERQGFEAFLPLAEQRRRAARRPGPVVGPMFPRYLFLRADAGAQSLATVRSTRGCVGLVRQAGMPATVPDAIIEDIQARSDEDGVFRSREVWKKGQLLEILQGPFSGLQAIYEASTSSERVRVLLQCLGGWQKATLPRHQVARLA